MILKKRKLKGAYKRSYKLLEKQLLLLYKVDFWNKILKKAKSVQLISFLLNIARLKYIRQPFRVFTFDIFKRKKLKRLSFRRQIHQQLKIMRYAYNFATDKQLRKFCIKIMKKHRKFNTNFHLALFKALELRFDVFVCRLNLYNTLREARKAIRCGKFLVNNVVVSRSSIRLKLHDIIEIKPEFRKEIKQRWLKMNLLTVFPPFLEINFKLCRIVFINELFNLENLIMKIRARFISAGRC